MRYSDTHKAETHTRLLKLAGLALREKGPDKLAVANLMAEAGLTHGGFYAHFASKEALLAEALESIFADSTQKLHHTAEGLPPRKALTRFIDSYVSSAHRDRVASGCPIVALNSDLPRQPRRFRAAFDAGVRALADTLAGWMEKARIDGGVALAVSVLAAMAGTVAVSRAVSDKRLSDQLLADARASIKGRLGLEASDSLEGSPN
jgi:TetR/AcrR family transcriptional regulator, transcriptional repressor for nem operon